MDEKDFDYTYVPEHLAEKVHNHKNLSFSERFNLIFELSEAAWAKIGVVRDPCKPMDKTVRRVTRSQDRWATGSAKFQVSEAKPGHLTFYNVLSIAAIRYLSSSMVNGGLRL